jgi:hypothetical protein
MPNQCPLCNSQGTVFYQYKKRLYYQCNTCSGIYADKSLWPNLNAEKLRYEQHINDVNDINYQRFVLPIVDAITNDFTVNDKGLDFGAGTGPVISKLLKDKSYSIAQYDPFFHNYPSLLTQEYNYIACCEVIEHFHTPYKEFTLLRKLLAPNGKLFCMTNIYNEGINFHDWYYKNDITHVFIYHENTIRWIKEEFGFTALNISDRLIIFDK